MKPTIGRIVHYVISDADASKKAGVPPSEGNMLRRGDVVPAIVVWPLDNTDQMFNGQAFLDGSDTLWLTSVPYDDSGAQGTWHWPPQVE